MKWRRAWRCGCDGVSDKFVGRIVSEDVRRVSLVIEKTCGAVPRTCPWFAFQHPLVVDVMTVRRHQRSKSLTRLQHLPVRLLDALAYFDDALKAARADRMDRDRKKREAERKRQGHD